VIQTDAIVQRESALADKVIEVFAEKLGKPARTIRLEDDLLLDLGIDSLSMAEMTVLVEQLGGVRIPGDALFDVQTVGDLVRLLVHYSSPSDQSHTA
jgi:acyl carrier protein